jgi:hypothetical protein
MTASVSPRAFDEANNISAELENVVVLDGLWSIRLAVSALVRCNNMVSSVSQRLQLMLSGGNR